jgi:hypothetical protein
MFSAALVRLICQKIAAESDLVTVRELNSLLLAVIKDNHEEVRLRIAYLARAHAITFDESKVLARNPEVVGAEAPGEAARPGLARGTDITAPLDACAATVSRACSNWRLNVSGQSRFRHKLRAALPKLTN